MPQTDFGTWLEGIRRRELLTQVDLADTTGIKNVTISHFENGHRLPTYAQAITLALELRVDSVEMVTRMMKERLSRTPEGRILMDEFRAGRFYDEAA